MSPSKMKHAQNNKMLDLWCSLRKNLFTVTLAMCVATGIRLCWSYYSLVLLHKSEYKSIIWNKLLLNYLWLWIDFTFFHIALQKPFLFKFESHSTEEDRISTLICILCVRKAIQCFQVYLLFYLMFFPVIYFVLTLEIFIQT